jgi:hypothetical protein
LRSGRNVFGGPVYPYREERPMTSNSKATVESEPYKEMMDQLRRHRLRPLCIAEQEDGEALTFLFGDSMSLLFFLATVRPEEDYPLPLENRAWYPDFPSPWSSRTWRMISHLEPTVALIPIEDYAPLLEHLSAADLRPGSESRPAE